LKSTKTGVVDCSHWTRELIESWRFQHEVMAEKSETDTVLGNLSASRPARIGRDRPGAARRPRPAPPQEPAPRPAQAARPKPVPPPPEPDSRRSGPPSGPELVTTAVQAVGEIAQIGLTAGLEVVRRAASRLPRP
jgi:hypothetical protein